MAGKLEADLKKRHGFDSVQQAVVIGMLRTCDQFQYRLGQLFREHGLTQPQYNVLRILRGEGGPLPSLEVASRLVTMVPAITSLIDKLEARGLVSRTRCCKDRRVWYVALTEAGAELLRQLDAPVLALHQTLCSNLSIAECEQLVNLMEKARSFEATTVEKAAQAS